MPQGAPTSPITSNLICAKLDSQLQRLAKQNRCTYTRYADDLTFSTTLRIFPSPLAKTISGVTEQIEIGDELHQVIKANGFEINRQKLRLQTKNVRQEVTGLTVNEFVNVQRKYVRQIRAMLHAWEKYGEEAAFHEFVMVYDRKHRLETPAKFGNVVKGKIDFLGMVKGKNNPNYIKFRNKLRSLAPDLVKEDVTPPRRTDIDPIVITEGKTDWKHLKAALASLVAKTRFSALPISFHEYEDDMKAGDVEMLETCKRRAKLHNNQPHIYIFDRDNRRILSEIESEGNGYKNWGNNVFAFAIPVPGHRQSTPEISIEFYYKDDEIKRPDNSGRRLFLSQEFNKRSGKHLENPLINCSDRNKYSAASVVIDHDVFDGDHQNIALPKNHFAEYVLKQESSFKDFDFSAFAKIFEVIEMIINENF